MTKRQTTEELMEEVELDVEFSRRGEYPAKRAGLLQARLLARIVEQLDVIAEAVTEDWTEDWLEDVPRRSHGQEPPDFIQPPEDE